MEFSVFFNQLLINDITSYNSEKILIEYKNNCVTENDYIQLYELKNILEVVNIFTNLHNAYLNCTKNNQDPLFEEIENLSNLLESNSISCYSYAYYFYVYLSYIFTYDSSLNTASRRLVDIENPEKMEWINPKKFDYSKLGETTFGVNSNNKNGLRRE